MTKMDILECDNCNNEFIKRSASVKYEKKKGQKTFFCSKECRWLYIKKKVVSLKCSHCEKEFEKDEKDYNKSLRKGKDNFYCSITCANKDRIMSEETKEKIATKLSAYYQIHEQKNKQVKTNLLCPICDNNFEVTECDKNRTYCSKVCSNNDTDFKYKNKPSGGYRKGSGRSLGGWYKGIYCDSTYELTYLIYCLDHNISIKRCTEKFEYGEGKTYNPDFIVGDTIIEIKGYVTEEVYTKADSVPDNINYKILTKDLMKKEFEYIKSKYNKTGTSISELYDNYKPKYIYKCNTCEKDFSVYRARKSEKVYCSRSCSGKSKHSTTKLKR